MGRRLKSHVKTLFLKMKDRNVLQALFEGGYQWERGGQKEKVKVSVTESLYTHI